MNLLSDATQRKEMIARASAFVGVAVSRDTWLTAEASESMRLKGWGRYFTKDADVLTSTDNGVALLPLASAFLGLVDAQSVLGRLDGAVHIPLASVGRLQVGTVVAEKVAEGASKPIARIAFSLSGDPVKVEAQIVVSAEALRCIDPATQAGITQVLVSACADATDTELVSLLTAGTPAASATPGDLFAAVSGGNPRRPYLVGGVDALLSLPAGTLRDLTLVGVSLLTSPAAAGFLIAIDAAGILLGDDTVTVSTARHASMEIDYGGSPSTSTMVSLWPANLACLRVERFIKLAVRSGAAAFALIGSP